ncbi:MAG: exodeoxyribonuclease V subunit gamma [Zoogloeaceae bacterium]|jgi:exodeoxyribonuclease V gamma subunit|nr:exodeoxyribonuclease V subunit gamma [Zoogloeaceae bacterium]
MLFLHTSNRYEILRDEVLWQLAAAPPDPFVAQEVIVPSAALQRDVALALARRHGVAAGVNFSFLALWLWRRIARLLPQVAPDSPFAPERACWRIDHILQDAAFLAAAPPLAGYLDRADALMRHELAERIAALFAAYIVYRPDYLEAWRQEKRALPPSAPAAARADEAWQAALWRRFTAELTVGETHPAATFFAALENLRNAGQDAAQMAGIAAGVQVFCPLTLPPVYLDMLLRLAAWTDIHLYLLNPCREYWMELVGAKQQARQELRGQADYLDTRHPLLADWGRQTQACMAMILEYTDGQAEETSRFSSAQEELPAGATPSLLARFQDSILDLTLPETGMWPLAKTDRSVEIHVAHSRMRQMEILHDQLRLAFEEDATLTPSEVLVALPDLEAALPLIEAIFGETGPGGIPYAITGQKATRENPVARLLLALMESTLPPARLPMSQVSALLQEPLAMAALELTADDLAQLSAALQSAGAHWGLGNARHGWRDALARLFLGYALPAPETELAPVFSGILPAGTLAGSRARLLGALWQLIERLERLAALLVHPRTAAGWRALWQEELAFWLDEEKSPLAPETQEARGSVLAAIDALCLDMAVTKDARIDPPVACAALEKALSALAAGGVPTGCVTFAALSSLRPLPYRMICLLGLEDGVFPQPGRTMEFDLMALENRPGDRQQRLDARNLFLDLVLAARDRLYLSYTGKSQRDDSSLPPSLLVAQLLEFCCRATGCPPERLQLQHPLQPFSPNYFNSAEGRDARLVSFHQEYAQAWQSRKLEISAEEPPFFPAPLSAPAAQRVSLAQMRAFFRHPARALLQDALRLALPEAAEEADDIEPLIAEPLPRYALMQRLLPAALAGEDAAALQERAMSGVEYPGGAWGEILVAHEIRTLAAYVERLLPLRQAYGRREEASTNFALKVEDFALSGVLRGFAPESSRGLLRYRCARAKSADYLEAWLEHLCLNAWALENGSPVSPKTCHVALDTTFVFSPVEQPLALLADWLAAWRQGQTAVLPFYPQTAWTWLQEGENKARIAWQGSDYGDNTPDPEKDAWWTLALRGQTDDPLGEAFAHWRELLLSPLLAHLETPGGAP